jgi:hypothetical protein
MLLELFYVSWDFSTYNLLTGFVMPTKEASIKDPELTLFNSKTEKALQKETLPLKNDRAY